MPILPFEVSEYHQRVAKVRAVMAERELDLIFIEDPSNICWLTGYDNWSFYVHQGVLLSMEGEPIWWGRKMDGEGALRTAWIDPSNIHRYGDEYVQATNIHPMEDLARLISELGFSQAKIGLELENYYFSAKAYLVLREALRDAEFLDATALVNWQRTVKSAAELLYMRKAGRISEKIIDGILERARPGLRKNELVAGIYHDSITGINDDEFGYVGGDYPGIVPLLPSGRDASASHITWDDQPMQDDCATFFEISGVVRRYHAPFCRTIYFGTLPDDLKRAEAAMGKGLEAGIQAARAGNQAGDIARALTEQFARAGIERTGRCGYPIGLSFPPDWGERTISLRENDTTILEAGMTFHFMPGLWTKEWGLETTETIVINDTGAANSLSDRPRKIFCID